MATPASDERTSWLQCGPVAWFGNQMDADAIVVGAGLAGLAATAELARAGRRVLLLDQEPESNLGGQAFWSFGGLFLVGSPERRRMGIRDSHELAWQDWTGSAFFDRGADDPAGEDYWAYRSSNWPTGSARSSRATARWTTRSPRTCRSWPSGTPAGRAASGWPAPRRRTRSWTPKAGPLIAVRLSILTRKTLGGLQTDLSGRVLGQDTPPQPVPGLFAAGEVAGFGGGGMHGYRSLEGSFPGGCLFSGRQAGRPVARATGGGPVSRTGAGTARRWCRRQSASPPPCPAPGPPAAPPR